MHYDHPFYDQVLLLPLSAHLYLLDLDTSKRCFSPTQNLYLNDKTRQSKKDLHKNKPT